MAEYKESRNLHFLADLKKKSSEIFTQFHLQLGHINLYGNTKSISNNKYFIMLVIWFWMVKTFYI